MLLNKGHQKSRIFRSLSPWFEVAISNSQMMVGSGEAIDFWCDNWLGSRPLLLRIDETPIIFPKLSAVLQGSSWNLNKVK